MPSHARWPAAPGRFWRRTSQVCGCSATSARTVPGFRPATFSSRASPASPSQRPINRRRKGSSDKRCEVLSHIIRYIERVAPSLIVMENVVGLLSHGRDVFLNLVQRLQAAGYSIAVKVLRSEVHGGVPQRRHRLFIVALRSPTIAMGWPGSIPMRSLPSILAKEVCPPGARPSAPKAAGKIDAVEYCLAPLQCHGS